MARQARPKTLINLLPYMVGVDPPTVAGHLGPTEITIGDVIHLTVPATMRYTPREGSMFWHAWIAELADPTSLASVSGLTQAQILRFQIRETGPWYTGVGHRGALWAALPTTMRDVKIKIDQAGWWTLRIALIQAIWTPSPGERPTYSAPVGVHLPLTVWAKVPRLSARVSHPITDS